MSFDEEKLLQTGIDAISKAFKTKQGNTKIKLNEREAMISNLQLRITHLEEENEQLKSTISSLQLENQQFKKQNTKLFTSLEEKKKKLQMIKKSILESTLVIPTMESVNTNSNSHSEKSKEAPRPHFIKSNNSNNIYQLYTKKTARQQPKGFSSHRANSHSISITNTNTNDNTTERIAIGNGTNSKNLFNKIETKINKIKGNLSSRDYSTIQTKDKNQSKDDISNNTFSINNDINTLKPKLQCSKSNSLIGNKPKSTQIRNKLYQSPSDQYERTNHFLNECNSQLSPQDFEQVLSLFQLMKEGSITPQEAYSKIKASLHNNKSLMTLVDSLFIID